MSKILNFNNWFYNFNSYYNELKIIKQLVHIFLIKTYKLLKFILNHNIVIVKFETNILVLQNTILLLPRKPFSKNLIFCLSQSVCVH